MPRTVNGLWAELTDFENLYQRQGRAAARLGKRYKMEVMKFAAEAEEALTGIQNHLLWKTWRPDRSVSSSCMSPSCASFRPRLR